MLKLFDLSSLSVRQQPLTKFQFGNLTCGMAVCHILDSGYKKYNYRQCIRR